MQQRARPLFALLLLGLSACIPDVVPTKKSIPGCTGVESTCGPDRNESCCARRPIPGGSFNRGNDPGFPAVVADFELDRFEVTVGRFRRFVEDYPEDKPTAGAGAHPLIPDSGWDKAWDASLPADQAALKASVLCDQNFRTWTDTAGPDDDRPINCVSWFVAFAFCAWDEGRLPTDAEWSFAASGGNQQRSYPWGADMPDPTYAVYGCSAAGEMPNDCKAPSLADIPAVGSRSPKGDGAWGHADLSGSMLEWTLDWFNVFPLPCDNCANITGPSANGDRSLWGGDWSHPAATLASASRITFPAGTPNQDSTGFRCARAK